GAVTDRALNRFGNVGIEKSPESVDLHSGHLSLPVADSGAGAFATISSTNRGLVNLIARVLFRAAELRSCFSSGVGIAVAVVVGWLCFVVSMGVCAVTCGHV